MMKDYLLAFVPIFVAVDALGMLPVFMAISDGMSPTQRKKLIQHSILMALFVAVAFIGVGRVLFEWLGITISDFLVAGGAILFIIAIRDLLAIGPRKKISGNRVGVVPLAVPLIAGPAVLTTSLILLNAYGFWPTFVSIVLNILLCGFILRFSDVLLKIIGEAGSNVLSKIFHLFLGAIGVMMVRRGVLEILSQWAGN